MKRLVIQLPGLDEDTVGGIASQIGRAADDRWPGGAFWRGVGIASDQARALAERYGVDAALVPDALRLGDFGLLTLDMDSTLINVECIDELADLAGHKDAVAAITEAAMRGEIADFSESLRRRLALLAGAPDTLLQRVMDDRVRLNPGAERLLGAARSAGLHTLLVSGGFTFFADRLAGRLALDSVLANELEIVDGRLTGRVVGPIVDASAKRSRLLATTERLGIAPTRAIAIGDGANDMPMMEAAGLSVAFHAKPVVRARASCALDHCGLDAVLNLFADQCPVPLGPPRA